MQGRSLLGLVVIEKGVDAMVHGLASLLLINSITYLTY